MPPRISGEKFVEPGNPDDINRRREVIKRQLINKDFPTTRLDSSGSPDGLRREDIDKIHGVSFLTEVIPRLIRQLEESGQTKKLRIIDIGAGLGFFIDQIREEFGDKVKTYGTSMITGKKARRPRDKAKNDIRRNGTIPFGRLRFSLSPLKEKQFARILETPYQENSFKWPELKNLRNFPEFDLMVDTFGEFYYALLADKNLEKWQKNSGCPNFEKLLFIALQKLAPNGELYIGMLGDTPLGVNYLWDHADDIQKKFGVKIYFGGRKTRQDLVNELLTHLPDHENIDEIPFTQIRAIVNSYFNGAHAKHGVDKTTMASLNHAAQLVYEMEPIKIVKI